MGWSVLLVQPTGWRAARVMVGYVQQVTTDGLLDAVNGFVATHTLMGNEHRLGKPGPNTSG